MNTKMCLPLVAVFCVACGVYGQTAYFEVQQKLFNQPVTIIDAGSLGGAFESVTPVFPLRAVDITYEAGTGNVVLSNFRYYTGTLISLN